MNSLPFRSGILLLAAALGVAALMGWSTPIDRALQDQRFAHADRAPSGDVVLIDIDSASLAKVGVWPWPRSVHAALLDQLMALGATDVVFDIDFSTASRPEEDESFRQALYRAGGYAYLAAFQQVSAMGEVMLNYPLAAFAEQAVVALVNVESDVTGMVRSVPAALVDPGVASVAVALAPGHPSGDTITIDYGIDLTRVERIPAAAILDGSVAPERIENRQVVIGASALELRDIFRVPRFGAIPGPLIQIAATETLKADRNLHTVSPWLSLSLVVLLAAFSAWVWRSISPGRLAMVLVAVLVVVESAAFAAYAAYGWLLLTSTIDLAVFGIVVLRYADDYAQRHALVVASRRRIAYLASHDEPTGVLSPLSFAQVVDDGLGQGRAPHVVVVELSRLRDAAQALGQRVADLAVVEVAHRLEQHAQAVGRLAPDRFALMLDHRLEASIQDRLVALAGVLEQPYQVGIRKLYLQASFGVAATSTAPERAVELLHNADMALSTAGEQPSRIAFFDPAHAAALQRRQELDVALRQALDNDEFRVLFQLQADIATGAPVGVEALLRWSSTTVGQVSPVDFIPLAESSGLIVPIGRWVLAQACQQAQACGWAGRLAINVSTVQFELADVVADVRAALAVSGFPPERLDIEVTESLMAGDEGRVVRILKELKALGVGIAIDDFGTGYSSLSYLAELPFDKLKVDQSFVRNLDKPASRAVVDTVVAMAHRLGKQVVAEGIETQDQLSYLANIGCDVGQGYLFGRPGALQPDEAPEQVETVAA